ncbi:MAG: ABC transporter permease [archaeon]
MARQRSDSLNLRNCFELSLNSILHRKLRSWLTLLGIVIGVAAVVSIISIGEGAQASVTEQLSSLGADMITVSPGYSRAGSFGGAFRGGGPGGGFFVEESSSEETPTLTKRDAIVIASNPSVKYVTEYVSGRADMVFQAEESSVTVSGVNTVTWKETANLDLASGRFLSASDSSSIVIGNRVANGIFKQDLTIGRRVVIGDKPFTVVGILAATGSGGFGGGNSDSAVYMSYESAWDVTAVESGTFSSIQAKVSNSELVDQVTEELTASLLLSRKVAEKNQDFSVTSAQAMQEQISSATETLTLFLGAIAAVSLLVGAVGVANSMFTSVLEKTKLIGILKALGATNGEIQRVFIIESGLFGLFGGVIGAIIGTLGSYAIGAVGIVSMPMMSGSSTLVTPQLVIVAIVLSTVVGIVSGLLPARAASKLRPVEALRYE